jgi:hypothetical protein
MKKYESDTVSQLLIEDWIFESSHDKICDSNTLIDLARQIENIINNEFSRNELVSNGTNLDSVNVGGLSLRLPPILFLQDFIKASFTKFQASISLNPTDALTSWASQHHPSSVAKLPLNVVQVPYSKTWQDRSLTLSSSEGNKNAENGQISSQSTSVFNYVAKWDWTFSSDYCCTVSCPYDIDELSTIISTKTLIDNSNPHLSYYKNTVTERTLSDMNHRMKWECKAAEVNGLDMDMLRAAGPNAPILFYDEVILYQVSKSLLYDL